MRGIDQLIAGGGDLPTAGSIAHAALSEVGADTWVANDGVTMVRDPDPEMLFRACNIARLAHGDDPFLSYGEMVAHLRAKSQTPDAVSKWAIEHGIEVPEASEDDA